MHEQNPGSMCFLFRSSCLPRIKTIMSSLAVQFKAVRPSFAPGPLIE